MFIPFSLFSAPAYDDMYFSKISLSCKSTLCTHMKNKANNILLHKHSNLSAVNFYAFPLPIPYISVCHIIDCALVAQYHYALPKAVNQGLPSVL